MDDYKNIKQNIQNKAQLCIVSKGRTREEILHYYHQGERIFAENRVQELLQKVDIANDIQWHFIGHLQRNKVRQILPYISCLQSLDNFPLASLLERECQKLNRSIDILIEVHLAKDDRNKTGLYIEECIPFIENCLSLPHLNIKGIMVMGPHTDDIEKINEVFQNAQILFLTLQKKFSSQKIQILSMGMSADYQIALKNGANLVRIGRALFKENDRGESL